MAAAQYIVIPFSVFAGFRVASAEQTTSDKHGDIVYFYPQEVRNFGETIASAAVGSAGGIRKTLLS